ncbi:MAG: DUF3369 domain-containing protein [Clostridia bacterium]|nr:DUF3369 domain-containing protein [Clostridia bacterium]
MRQAAKKVQSNYRIAILDDEAGIIDTISIVLKRNGYEFEGFTDQLEAIERIKEQHFDMLILDYLMDSMHGDEVVERIRRFNKEIYILLLTGHKDIAPPLETIRSLEIQGYCEKSDRFDQLILLIESGIKSIQQVQTINKFKEGLNRILEAVPEIYQLQPVACILEKILTGILPFVNAQDAFILIDDTGQSENSGNKSIFRGIGKYHVEIEQFMQKLNPSVMACIGYARTTGKYVNMENELIFPLVNEYSKTIGVMYIDGSGTEDGLKLLEIYSRQAASSISNAFLHSMVNMKNEELNKTYEELKIRYMDTVEVLRLAVDAKDEYTRGHSDRVAYYAVKIGEAFGLPADEIDILKLGGVFHDIGKIGTADDILFKTESLDNREYTEVKRHTLKGAHILSAVSMFKDVVPLVKYHHERLDGKGYPEGLMGEEIPFLARILSVADAFDAMTSDRVYRNRLELNEAIEQLTNASGTQFDPEVVDKFVKLLDRFEGLPGDIEYAF